MIETMRKPLAASFAAILVLAASYQGSPFPAPLGQGMAPNARYGVIISGPSETTVSNLLGQLNMATWYEFGESPTNPPGYQKVELVRARPTDAPVSVARLQARAANNPGSYWLISNEPNVDGQDDVAPQRYAELYHYYYTNLKAIDPQSKLVAPNILNWEFTCRGCPGFNVGRQWVQDFLQAYRNLYQSEAPVDVWGIHAYTIDWWNLPMVDYQTGIQQLRGFREYLDSIPSQRGKPIWVTEFGVIWGFEGIAQADTPDKVKPEGAYREDLVANYLRGTLEWLNSNAAQMNIERWLIYTSYGYPEPYATQYAGISLFDGPGPTASLTNLGRLYRDMAAAGSAAPTPTPGPTPMPTASPSPGSGAQVSYGKGWNIVAGPGGTAFARANPILYTWQGDAGYTTLANTQGVTEGWGYWACFANDTQVNISGSGGTSYTTTLAPDQWKMVGNPGSVKSATVTAEKIYTYDAVAGYSLYFGTANLPVGGGAWVYSMKGGTVTVSAQ